MFNLKNFLPMTGFEPRTSGLRSNRSTNWATQALSFLFLSLNHFDVIGIEPRVGPNEKCIWGNGLDHSTKEPPQ